MRGRREAIELCRQIKPDVVLLDLNMPDLDGLATARAVRRDPKLAHLRLVALTGRGTWELRRKAIEAGFDEFLVKPVPVATLIKALRPRPSARSAGRALLGPIRMPARRGGSHRAPACAQVEAARNIARQQNVAGSPPIDVCDEPSTTNVQCVDVMPRSAASSASAQSARSTSGGRGRGVERVEPCDERIVGREVGLHRRGVRKASAHILA